MLTTQVLVAVLAALTAVKAAPAADKHGNHGKKPLPHRLGGVNLAGYDFGMQIDGSYTGGAMMVSDINTQINTFRSAGANLFRCPFGLQWMTGNNVDATSLPEISTYATFVNAVTATGAYAIVDMHNYARWNGEIFGQGGPSNEQLANLWAQIATEFKDNRNVIFGIMNEPHDVPSTSGWAATVQTVVNAIRNAGATSQHMLIPGNDWTHAPDWSDGNDNPLLAVTDIDGTTDKLLLDVHQYLDVDNSGTHDTCTTNNVDVLTTLNTWLQGNGRKAILSESGGSSDQSCLDALGQELAYVTSSSNIIGFATWSAGSFDESYVLSETPTNNGATLNTVGAMVAQYFPKGR